VRAAIFNEPRNITAGDRPDAAIREPSDVISPFAFSDGTCPDCQNGITTACMNGGFFPMNGDGGQGEGVRVPLADTTLVTVPGSGQGMQTAIDIARAGSMRFVGVPHGVELPIGQMFSRTVGVRGGGAPVRVYLPELLEDALTGRINPRRVLDYETDLFGIGDAYAAVDERRAIKSLVRVASL
jgi:threonine dehydrogenase-like Zn-dependent dehydrogenase